MLKNPLFYWIELKWYFFHLMICHSKRNLGADHNPKSQILTIFSTFFKSQKWCAQNEAIFGGQNRKNAKYFFQKFLLSQIVRNIIPINYIPIKAMLTPLVSRKNAKNCQNGIFHWFLTCFRPISWLLMIQWLVFMIVWVQWRVIETSKLSKKPF